MLEAEQIQKTNQEQEISGLRTSTASQYKVFLFAAIGVFCVLIAYVFLISVGTWTNWPTTSTYYDQLATSFRQGKLSLDQVPDPALLALSNPYDPDLRVNVEYPRDISLYKGKFHLYFGPVPALVLLFIKIFVTGEIGDQYLVFAFTLGILLIEVFLLIKIWNRAFSDIPSWLILPCILVVGLTSPFGWMLGLSSVYNASILGGQFFFLAGLYTVWKALDHPSISRIGLVLTGIFWICAIGSRIAQVIPVGCMLILAVAWIVIKRRNDFFSARTFIPIVSLGLPLFIGTLCLGWYNWARFDSVLEIGTTYALAGPDLQKYQKELFSPSYTANNVYNYFLIKPDLKKKFPFINPVHGQKEPVIKTIQLPDVYFSQEVAGLLYISPFILFAFPTFIFTLDFLHKGPGLFRANNMNTHVRWLIIGLLSSFLSSLLFFLFFFWVGVRYQAEFIPALAILSVIGFWQIYRCLPQKRILRIVYTVLGLILATITIVNSNLIAISVNSARYRELNPELWSQLAKFFNNFLH